MKRLKDVNWNQVYYFYEVARRLSMTQASQYLGVSVPTVSEQIKRLEERLDVQLFRREVRRLELSPEGEALFHCAREMFEAGFRFLDTISPESIGGYTVRVGVQETILMASLQAVARYWDVFAPYGTVTTIREPARERLVERILKGELDWGITIEPPESGRLETREIGSFEVVFCAAKDIFQRFKRPEDMMRSLPLMRNGWDDVLNGMVDDRLRAAGAYPEEIVSSDHKELCLMLAHRGRCVTTFSGDVLKTSPWGDGLQTFHIGEPMVVKLYAVWNRASGRMIALRKLQEVLESPPAEGDRELALRVAEIPPDWLVGGAPEPAKDV